MSRSSRGSGSISGQDLYKLLQIPHGSDLSAIKVAYKKLALQFHPDRHNGDTSKTKHFHLISEAYTILSNDLQRRQYDLQNGFRYNKNRRAPPPKNYRKVYAPVPPPHVKRSFDHQKHYDMHYGSGMMNEAVKDAQRTAIKEGVDFGYQSPLGKGFAFDKNGGINDTINPYSKKHRHNTNRNQTIWEYEEGTMWSGGTDGGNSSGAKMRGGSGSGNGGKTHKRATVEVNLDGHRIVRKQAEATAREKAQRDANSAFPIQDETSCVIQ